MLGDVLGIEPVAFGTTVNVDKLDGAAAVPLLVEYDADEAAAELPPVVLLAAADA